MRKMKMKVSESMTEIRKIRDNNSMRRMNMTKEERRNESIAAHLCICHISALLKQTLFFHIMTSSFLSMYASLSCH